MLLNFMSGFILILNDKICLRIKKSREYKACGWSILDFSFFIA